MTENRSILEEVAVGLFTVIKCVVLAFVWIIVFGCLLTKSK